MAGLDRKVLNSRRITKQVAPSNPVFNRSFITSFGVASYSKGRMLRQRTSVPCLFLAEKTYRVWPFAGKGVHLQRKTKNLTRQ